MGESGIGNTEMADVIVDTDSDIGQRQIRPPAKDAFAAVGHRALGTLQLTDEYCVECAETLGHAILYGSYLQLPGSRFLATRLEDPVGARRGAFGAEWVRNPPHVNGVSWSPGVDTDPVITHSTVQSDSRWCGSALDFQGWIREREAAFRNPHRGLQARAPGLGSSPLASADGAGARRGYQIASTLRAARDRHQEYRQVGLPAELRRRWASAPDNSEALSVVRQGNGCPVLSGHGI